MKRALKLRRFASKAALGLLALRAAPGPAAEPPPPPVATCFALPVDGYRPQGILGYLQRNPGYGNLRHVADDYFTPAGTEVVAAAAGRVMYARAYRSCPDWGYLIVIEHRLPDGESVSTIYGHARPSVAEGAIVQKGQPIGAVARFPCWNDHVHFGVARSGYGAPVGRYADWVHGYLLDSEPVAPYTDPIAFVAAHADCQGDRNRRERPGPGRRPSPP
jgi:murein DD-endopeptidase MepM/ murein hydrolase activator NlpD